jgi:hypothetical protein
VLRLRLLNGLSHPPLAGVAECPPRGTLKVLFERCRSITLDWCETLSGWRSAQSLEQREAGYQVLRHYEDEIQIQLEEYNPRRRASVINDDDLMSARLNTDVGPVTCTTTPPLQTGQRRGKENSRHRLNYFINLSNYSDT